MTLSPSRSRLLAHLLLIAVVAVWGATFPLVKGALVDVSPLLFNLLRMALATLALAALNRKRIRSLSRTEVLQGVIAGAFLGAGYQFQTAGLARTSPTKSAFITGLVVVFVALATTFSPLAQSEAAILSRIAVVLGAILAFAGLALLTVPAAAQWSVALGDVNRGDALTLVCAVAFAGHLLTLARIQRGTSAGPLATIQIGCASLLMLFSLRANGPLHLHVSSRFLVALIVTSLLATAAAFTVQSWAQQHLPASHTAALLTLEPVFALLTSIVFFGEQLTFRIYAGATLIFFGILLIERLGSPVPPDPFLGSPPSLPPLGND